MLLFTEQFGQLIPQAFSAAAPPPPRRHRKCGHLPAQKVLRRLLQQRFPIFLPAKLSILQPGAEFNLHRQNRNILQPSSRTITAPAPGLPGSKPAASSGACQQNCAAFSSGLLPRFKEPVVRIFVFIR